MHRICFNLKYFKTNKSRSLTKTFKNFVNYNYILSSVDEDFSFLKKKKSLKGTDYFMTFNTMVILV